MTEPPADQPFQPIVDLTAADGGTLAAMGVLDLPPEPEPQPEN